MSDWRGFANVVYAHFADGVPRAYPGCPVCLNGAHNKAIVRNVLPEGEPPPPEWCAGVC